MKTKWLAIGIILLFVGVTIAPTINFNTVTASQDDDLVEVTTQACGIQGYGNTTVKLTREQYQDLEEYLVEFRERLNQTSTREEAVPLFKEAVVELDKYGLLPRGMSVERAQKLIVSENSNRFDKLFQVNQKSFTDYSNINCLIFGKTNSVFITGFLLKIFNGFCLWRNHDNLYEILSFPIVINSFIIFFLILPWIISPVSIFTVLHFGSVIPGYYGYCNIPSEGYIHSIGSLGNKEYNGSFYGSIPIRPLLIFESYMIFGYNSWIYYPGILGYTGLKLYLGTEKPLVLLGSALSVNISVEPPEINGRMILNTNHLKLSE